VHAATGYGLERIAADQSAIAVPEFGIIFGGSRERVLGTKRLDRTTRMRRVHPSVGACHYNVWPGFP
jgi:hypothetical protein